MPLAAAELRLDFGDTPEGKVPPGFRSALAGHGRPGEWKVLMDEVPSLMEKLTPEAPSVARRPVLAQVSTDPTDERFPLLIYEKDTFKDFTFTTRFKTVRGVIEQMAGIAFRIQNETNYYVVRASSIGNTFRFYKVVNGERGTLYGPQVEIPSGVWHELSVQCTGNKIQCLLDGKELIPTITDSSFTSGKIGFWTKSDSVSYFTDARVTYTPREPAAQALVRAIVAKYPKLEGLRVYAAGKEPQTARLIASKVESEIGQPGGSAEADVLAQGSTYTSKGKGTIAVILPMRDRNGDVIAAVRVELKRFTGQTEQNAIVRATPIVREMQGRVQSLQDLME